MATTITGVVKEGKVVPEVPLPEGMRVQILLPAETPSVPEDLQEELDAWTRGSSEALALVERLAEEETTDAEG
ncbi:MAG TPA: hypothetical protein VGZ25_11990 [Gemmataceae bacterium]|jgi:hypothetical protein|nr:hypothetical protein [Gemmataceae bacterium]